MKRRWTQGGYAPFPLCLYCLSARLEKEERR